MKTSVTNTMMKAFREEQARWDMQQNRVGSKVNEWFVFRTDDSGATETVWNGMSFKGAQDSLDDRGLRAALQAAMDEHSKTKGKR